MATVAGQVRERFWHEGRAITMFFCDGLRHEFEKCMAIGGRQAIRVVPVHLELTVGVFVIVLVGVPPQR